MSRPVLASLAGFRRPSWLAAWRARGLGAGEHVVAWRMRRDAVMPEVSFPAVPDDLSGLEDAG